MDAQHGQQVLFTAEQRRASTALLMRIGNLFNDDPAKRQAGRHCHSSIIPSHNRLMNGASALHLDRHSRADAAEARPLFEAEGRCPARQPFSARSLCGQSGGLGVHSAAAAGPPSRSKKKERADGECLSGIDQGVTGPSLTLAVSGRLATGAPAGVDCLWSGHTRPFRSAQGKGL